MTPRYQGKSDLKDNMPLERSNQSADHKDSVEFPQGSFTADTLKIKVN